MRTERPQGATHVGVFGGEATYYKLHDEHWSFFAPIQGQWSLCKNNRPALPVEKLPYPGMPPQDILRLNWPKQRYNFEQTINTAQFIGRGRRVTAVVPEAGQSLQIRQNGSSYWVAVEILGVGLEAKKVFVRYPNGVERLLRTDNYEFREIKTPEQLAAEERDAGVDALIQFALFGARGNGTHRPFWERAYDAGLRAPEVPK